jgi:hypothetical protein
MVTDDGVVTTMKEDGRKEDEGRKMKVKEDEGEGR